MQLFSLVPVVSCVSRSCKAGISSNSACPYLQTLHSIISKIWWPPVRVCWKQISGSRQKTDPATRSDLNFVLLQTKMKHVTMTHMPSAWVGPFTRSIAATVQIL